MLVSLVWVVVAAALVFDFTNGFHDSANAIATSISTRALSPTVALGMAAILNVAGGLVSVEVAHTLGQGIVDSAVVTPTVVLATLVGAIIWNIITWYFGLPSSSSHALIGGLAGAVLAKASTEAVLWMGIFEKVVIPTIVSPVIGFVAGAILLGALFWIFRKHTPGPINRIFRHVQTVSAAAMAFSHGANDAQKTMGIITGVLFTAGYLEVFEVPFWVVLAAHVAIGLGTLSGGWRIVKTMGTKITKLTPVGGFAAETGAAASILLATLLGVGISTTHTITGSIVGVGATRRLSAVRWGIAGQIVWAWVLTIPAAATVGALTYWLLSLLGADA